MKKLMIAVFFAALPFIMMGCGGGDEGEKQPQQTATDTSTTK